MRDFAPTAPKPLSPDFSKDRPNVLAKMRGRHFGPGRPAGATATVRVRPPIEQRTGRRDFQGRVRERYELQYSASCRCTTDNRRIRERPISHPGLLTKSRYMRVLSQLPKFARLALCQERTFHTRQLAPQLPLLSRKNNASHSLAEGDWPHSCPAKAKPSGIAFIRNRFLATFVCSLSSNVALGFR
jgi:hypothetical protein